MKTHVAYTINVEGAGAVQFCDQLVASISSLKESSCEDEVECHVLYANIPVELMRKLTKLSSEKFKMDFVPIRKDLMAFLQNMCKNSPSSQFRTWSGIVFVRLYLANILPEEVGRCIYLDSDTLVLKSLKELAEADLEGKTFGMVMGVVPEYGYNSGVILMDLEKIRDDKEFYSRLSSFMKSNARSYLLPDQTVINRFMKDDIKELDSKWNYPPTTGLHDPSMKHACIWHFYNCGRKPYRIASDDAGMSLLEWNRVLSESDKITLG